MLDEDGRVIYASREMGVRRMGDAILGEASLRELFPQYYSVLRGEVPWLTPQEADITRQLPEGDVHERIWLRRMQWGACLIIVDQTQLRELESADAQTARLATLGFMVAGVCHEVSNPLAAIHSMVQILRADPKIGPDVLEKGLTNIAANVKRILDISRRLVDFSKVGDEPRTAFPVDVSIDEALMVLQQDRQFEQIELKLEPDPAAIMFGNIGQMQEVFSNIFLNAIQAMERKGRLCVMTRRKGGEWIQVVIRDNGPGIPVEFMPRLFEPFFTTKPIGRGTGLGLAISNEIIREHGGIIRAENNADKGASFYVELPAYEKRL
jgi:signal transduction histidine kinase